MDSFYVTLPSNVKSNLNNTVAKYQTKLASRKELYGKWEVGLFSISYTKSWYNIPEEERITFYYFESPVKIEKISQSVIIPKGNYISIDNLLDSIRDQINEIALSVKIDLPQFELNEISNKIEIKLTHYKNSLILPGITKNLANILGFNNTNLITFVYNVFENYKSQYYDNINNNTNQTKWKLPKQTNQILEYYAEQPYDLCGKYRTILVSTDIIEQSNVGKDSFQLLGCVEIPNNAKFGEQILINYSNIQYIPLQTHDFQYINIELIDENRDLIPFQFGRSIIVLHFRKII